VPRPYLFSLAIVLTIATFTTQTEAQGTYAVIDDPDAVLGTVCYGLNTAGEVVGVYTDADNFGHGFLFSGGTYTTIDYPKTQATFLSGINDSGAIVGYAYDPSYGFVYDRQNGTFTNLLKGGWFTFPYGINDAGTITGYTTEFDHGFELSASGQEEQVVPPGSVDTHPMGVSALGEVVGFYYDGLFALYNFSFRGNEYRQLQIPDAPLAVVFGINPAGAAVVGSYSPAQGVTAGFVYRNSTLTTLQFPGSSNTSAASINAEGQVAGTFYDASGKYHGFLWTPAGN